MTRYLDYTRMSDILARYYPHHDETGARLVGPLQQYDSGYFDIVRFFNDDTPKPSDVAIKHLAREFEFADPLVAEFASRVEQQMRADGRLCDGPMVMRVAEASMEHPPYGITVQPANYGAQAGSCFALDLMDPVFEPYGGTLRDYVAGTCSSEEIAASPLCVCPGVCGLLLTRDGAERYVLFVRRSAKLASLEASVGPSAAGSIDYRKDVDNLQDLTIDSMAQEVTEELGLHREQFMVLPLAWAREIFRGDKPQLFCLITTTLTRDEIAESIREIDPERREFDSYWFSRLLPAGGVGPEELDQLNHEAAMNVMLLAEYLHRQA